MTRQERVSVIHALTEELVRRGHEVTLFAAGTSLTSARLVAGSPVPLWQDGIFDARGHESAQVADVVERSGQFDIIPSHADCFAAPGPQSGPGADRQHAPRPARHARRQSHDGGSPL